jgi:hypothetical protein
LLPFAGGQVLDFRKNGQKYHITTLNSGTPIAKALVGTKIGKSVEPMSGVKYTVKEIL